MEQFPYLFYVVPIYNPKVLPRVLRATTVVSKKPDRMNCLVARQKDKMTYSKTEILPPRAGSGLPSKTVPTSPVSFSSLLKAMRIVLSR